MKRTIIITAAALILSVVATSQHFTPARKLQFAQQVIENFYVDTLDAGKVVEDGIVAMLKSLDPHSLYSNAEETRELTEPLQGNFSGIGIQFNMATDTVYVIQTVAGGPSEKVGIVSGDRIIAANDTVLAGRKLRNTEVMKHLRGPKGSEVKLTVLRRGEPKPIDFIVRRDDIPIYSIDAYYMVKPGVGYIRLSRFGESTAREMAEALGKLRKQGMKDVIIDLEDNGGGYLEAATALCQMFLKKGDLMVYTKGEKMPSRFLRSESNPIMGDGKVVVMVNQYSASASEIFSGAIQDQDRGLVVGRRTFGKGLVQRPFPMPDGSMIRLTVARYYTPSGRCIQKPYSSGDQKEYSKDILERYEHGEFSSADSIRHQGNVFYTLRSHRPVYEGGGIIPDLFVPIDTAYYSDYYRNLVAKGIINKYVLRYVDSERHTVKKRYPKVDDFVDNFRVTDPMVDDIIAMGTTDSIKYDEAGMAKSRATLTTIVKALIARDIYDDQAAYYRIANQLNPTFREAVELIADDRRYADLLKPQN